MPSKSEVRLAGLHHDYNVGRDAAGILDHPLVDSWGNACLEGLLNSLCAAAPGQDGHAEREGITAQIRALRGLRQSLTDAKARGQRAESQMSASTPDG